MLFVYAVCAETLSAALPFPMSLYSKLPDNTPLLVGAGTVMQKQEDPQQALEPLALMLQALHRAEQDAGVTGLLREADSIQVPQGFWAYGDPGRRLATEIGAVQARSALAEIGVLQHSLLSRACRAIAEGTEQVVLITGGEARYRTLCAARAGIELEDPDPGEEDTPDIWLQSGYPLSSELENERGLVMPVAAYAVIESALRHARGLGIREHREEVAALVSAMSRIAATNEDAWEQREYTPEQLINGQGKNAMLAFPYTKLHASQWNVDQAAGLILCSAGVARRHGIAEERWVFPLAAAEVNRMVFLAQREHLHRSPGARLAAEAALELAEVEREELDFLDLYSCFPAALQLHALELGLPLSPEKIPTITGGMRFAGGPLNNYVLQATARMAQCLRGKPGSTGLVSCVSGILNKHGFAVWASRAPTRPFDTREPDKKMRKLSYQRKYDLETDYLGTAEIAGYTVLHQGEKPVSAVAVCTLPGPEKRRTVAQCEDPRVIERMMQEEFCTRPVHIEAEGKFSLP